MISDIKTLKTASASDISFYNDYKFHKLLADSGAGACILKESDAHFAPATMPLIFHSHPQWAYAETIRLFYDDNYWKPSSYTISPQAVIDPSAKIGDNCCIEAGVNIGPNAVIGAYCHIKANAYIGRDVKIGNSCYIGSGCGIEYAVIGDNCILHHGCVIGSDGLGFAVAQDGSISKILHVGTVKIGNNVELGANSLVERAVLEETVIGDHCKIAGAVHIAHNNVIMDHCIISGQVGIAGSCTIGKGCWIGGQAGIAPHLHIGNGVRIAGKSGVIRDIPDGMTVGGLPAVEIREWHRQSIILHNLSANK